MSEEKSQFLINQERIMEQRARQERNAEEREALRLVPAVIESGADVVSDTEVITRYTPATDTIERRVVTSLPPPVNRLTRPAPLSLDEVQAKLVEAGNEIDAAKDRYQADNASLDVFYAEQRSVKLEIAELQQQLAEKQARLNELDSQGSPKDRYLSAIIAGERSVAEVGGLLLATLSEQAAQRIFGVSFDELSGDSKRDVQAKFRKTLHKYVTGFYMRLGRNAETATPEQVEKRSDELLADLEAIYSQHFDK